MKYLVSLLLCLALPAYAMPHAEGVANMKAQCQCVMSGGVCRVTNRAPAKPGSKVFSSIGPIDAQAYNRIRNSPDMCNEGEKACSVWESEECRAFRVMFRQEPVVCDQR